ncbi:MAG: signal peptidase II [Acidimicrobiales bacterium]
MRSLQERGTVPPLAGGRRRLPALGVTTLAVLVADQVTKSLALANLAGSPVHLAGPVYLHLELNSGVAFSLGRGHTPIVIAVVVVLVVAIAGAALRAERTVSIVALGLVLGGALGNLGDRLFRHEGGAVVDFVYTTFWPTFNVADACIVVGCVLLVVSFLRR